MGRTRPRHLLHLEYEEAAQANLRSLPGELDGGRRELDELRRRADEERACADREKARADQERLARLALEEELTRLRAQFGVPPPVA